MSRSILYAAIIVALLTAVAVSYWYLQPEPATPVKTEQNLTKQPPPATKKSASQESTTVEPAVAPKTVAASSSCTADPSWFPHSQTQRTNDAAFVSSSNCVFHQWAWQNFLWLTQEVNGQPRFLSFTSPESLLGMDAEGLMPRTLKSDAATPFDEFLQAGTDGIFVGHNNRAVYYSQYLDDTFVTFIEKNNLTDPAALRSLVTSDPTTEFPIIGTAGAMELKASWLIVEPGFDTTGMFTTQTQIAQLKNGSSGIVIDPSSTETVTVALVGFHIAGIVEGHPEMIWATFEHKNNAPNVPPGLGLEEPVSDQDFTFYTANTTLADCNINYASSDQIKLDESQQTLTPITQACRQYQFGNQPGVNSSNDQHIDSLNASVQAALDEDDVWKNYHEVGAIWMNKIDGLQPGMSFANDDDLTGSVSLSNSTIETFTQVASTENNCFRCHNTLQQLPQQPNLEPLPASNLNISHALMNIYFWSQSNAQSTNQPSGE